MLTVIACRQASKLIRNDETDEIPTLAGGGPMDVEQVTRLRSVISRLARQLNDTSTDEGLTPTQYSVLGLVRNRGPLGLAELASLEGLNPTMLSRVVKVLDERG